MLTLAAFEWFSSPRCSSRFVCPVATNFYPECLWRVSVWTQCWQALGYVARMVAATAQVSDATLRKTTRMATTTYATARKTARTAATAREADATALKMTQVFFEQIPSLQYYPRMNRMKNSRIFQFVFFAYDGSISELLFQVSFRRFKIGA